MNYINRLWELQQHTNNYLAIKKRLKQLSTKDNINEIREELNRKERELKELEKTIKQRKRYYIKQ